MNLSALVVRLSRTRLSATGWPIRKSASGGGEPHRQALLLGDRLDDVAHRLEDVGHRERDRIEIDQAVAAAGQLDHVARHRAEAEGRAVDQAELALLHRIDRAAPAALQGLGQEEDRGERRAEVVRHLDHQLEPVGPGEPVGEVLRPVGLEPLAHLLDRAEQPQQLAGVGRRAAPAARSRNAARISPSEPAGERVPGQRGEIGGLVRWPAGGWRRRAGPGGR